MIDWSLALKIIIAGVVLVTVILTGLAGIMELVRRIHTRGIRNVFKEKAPSKEVSKEELSGKEAAAILGAVLEYMEVTKKKSSLPSPKKWTMTGRKNLMKSLNRETPTWGKDKSSLWNLSGRGELMKSKGINTPGN